MPDDIKEPTAPHSEPAASHPAAEPTVSPEPHSELPPSYPSEEQASVYSAGETEYVPSQAVVPVAQLASQAAPPPPPPPPKPPAEEDEDNDPEERGMLRMSFMEHLEDLRSIILRAVAGILVAFFGSFIFATNIWRIVSAPAVSALREIGVNPPHLVAITPMEQFNVIYLKLPLLVSLFVGSPWIFYQVWSFISPGLYKREKRWATPFILTTAGLFVAGGMFAYFVAFRLGLVFLLGIGRDINVSPMVSIDEYFDLFVNVTLGVGLVFEMPVIIFFLTLLRVASPRFLLKHSRYAILAITVIAAIVTPTPDAFNMTLFTVPMIALYFIGLFASYLLVLRREGKKFPWAMVALVGLGVVLLASGAVALMIYHFHFHWVAKWPLLTQ
jgi:sec-independent protein translocase protein TatC